MNILHYHYEIVTFMSESITSHGFAVARLTLGNSTDKQIIQM